MPHLAQVIFILSPDSSLNCYALEDTPQGILTLARDCRFLKFKTKFAAEDFSPVNFTLFMILWYMHINQQTIKKNYLNRIKEIFQAGRVDNSRSFFFFFFFCFPRSSKPFLFTTGYVWVYILTKVLYLELLIFSTHEIKRVRWRQKR